MSPAISAPLKQSETFPYLGVRAVVVKFRQSIKRGVKQTIIGPDNVEVIGSRNVLFQSVNGYGVDHPFWSEGFEGSGATIRGTLGGVTDFSNSPSGLYNVMANGLSNSLPGPPASITALLARTNPSKPSVQLPVFWLELKDLPDMLRQVGRIAKRIYFDRRGWSSLIRPGHITEDMAAANLAIQFGWRPFVSDLWKIATMQDAVERRRKELKRLSESRGLSKSAHFGIQQVSEQRVDAAHSDYGAYIGVVSDVIHTCEVWGVAKWKPTIGVPLPASDGALRRQLTGLTPDAILSNVWEALPWSWLIDWFIPIGDTINAGNRTIATPVSTCIMRRRKSTAISRPQPPSGLPYFHSGGTFKWYSHERAVEGSFTETASYPTLGANQLSILASLAVLRGR